ILAGLQKSPYRIELYVESLQFTLFPDEAFRHHFHEEFERKYSSRKPDVVIAAGLASFKFIAESNGNFLERIPVIFCVNLGDIPDHVRPDLHFTGVSARLHPKETLDAALRLLPGTKHVVVTGGLSQFDNGFLTIAKQAFKSYKSNLDFTYLTDLTMPDLIE